MRWDKLCCAWALAAAASVAWAQADGSYPNRPIRLIVPYPPGASTNDILGRGLAQRLGPQEFGRYIEEEMVKRIRSALRLRSTRALRVIEAI